MSNDVRFIVTVDIEDAESLEDAYRQLRMMLPPECSYEVDEEYYYNEELGSPMEFADMRMKVLADEESRPFGPTMNLKWFKVARGDFLKYELRQEHIAGDGESKWVRWDPAMHYGQKND
ncbi:MAG: hypothetical protein ACYTBJ_20250 [Planctomycetota bacterium]|jgi:hypothetical protein